MCHIDLRQSVSGSRYRERFLSKLSYEGVKAGVNSTGTALAGGWTRLQWLREAADGLYLVQLS